MNSTEKAAATLGRIGGSVTSEAKAEAARANGTKGGRPSPYRRVSMQNGGDRIYRVPETGHWAGWRDADAVVYHGELVAVRTSDGWEGEDITTADKRAFSRLKSVGISTRR